MPGVSEGRPPCSDRRRRTRCLCAGCASPRARRRPRGGRSRPRASPSRARHATSAGSPPRWSTRRTPPGRTPRTCAPCAACSRGVPVRVVVVPPLVRRGGGGGGGGGAAAQRPNSGRARGARRAGGGGGGGEAGGDEGGKKARRPLD